MADLPKTYKVWACAKKGLENLELQEHDLPTELGDYDVLLKVKSAALNPVDYKICEWEGGVFNSTYPKTVGIDHIGQVVRLGSKVDPTIYKVNETVLLAHGSLASKSGAFGEYKIQDVRTASIVPQELIARVGESIYTDLATIPCAGYTALQAVETKLKLNITKNPLSVSNRLTRNIVVTAAAGGVGYFALQLLNLWRTSNFTEQEQQNVRIIATCSKTNFEFVHSLGATHAIDYNTENVPERIKEILFVNGEQEYVDAWIDLVDSKTTEQGLKALGFDGELVVIVENTDYKDQLFAFSKSVHNVCLGLAHQNGQPKHRAELKHYGDVFIDLYSQNKLKIEKTVIPLTEVKNSLFDMKKRHTRGKIVIQL